MNIGKQTFPPIYLHSPRSLACWTFIVTIFCHFLINFKKKRKERRTWLFLKYVQKRFTPDWDPTLQVEPLAPSSSAAKQRLMAQTRQLEEIKNAANVLKSRKRFSFFYSFKFLF